MAEQNGNPGAADAQSGASASNTNTNPQDASGGGQQPVAGGEGRQEAAKTFSYKEDRSEWIPRQRLNESNAKYEQRIAAYEERIAKIEQQQEGVKKAFGVNTPSKEESEAAELREALYKVLPNARLLERLDEEQLAELLEAAKSAKHTTGQHWNRVASEMIGDARLRVAEEIGVEELTPTQIKRLDSAYREEAQASMIERKAAYQRGERDTLDTLPSDRDFLARHERGDKKLIAEFTKAFLDDWFVPAKRSAASALERRNRPVPSGGRSRVPVTTKMPDVDLSTDEGFRKAFAEARAQR